jgi:hypothetical protein
MQKPIPSMRQEQWCMRHDLTSSDYSTSFQLTKLNTIPNILNLTSTAHEFHLQTSLILQIKNVIKSLLRIKLYFPNPHQQQNIS